MRRLQVSCRFVESNHPTLADRFSLMSRSLTTGRYPTDTAVAQQMIAEIERELGVRIRPLVAHWPEDEIAALLRRMAEIKYKYEGSAAVHW